MQRFVSKTLLIKKKHVSKDKSLIWFSRKLRGDLVGIGMRGFADATHRKRIFKPPYTVDFSHLAPYPLLREREGGPDLGKELGRHLRGKLTRVKDGRDDSRLG